MELVLDILALPVPAGAPAPAVVPVLVGPLAALWALLPVIAAALASALLAMFKPSAIKKFFLLLWSQKLVVTVVIAVIVGAAYIKSIVFPGRRAASAAQVGEASWPLWRGGPERRGAVLDAEDPSHGEIEWSFTDGKMRTFYSSPAVVGNRVYVASARWEFYTKEGAIYGLDADTGELVWRYAAGGYRPTFSSPAVRGKYLVVGEGLHLTENARVFCLDVEASELAGEGVRLWEYRTKSHVESSPCIFDDKVCIGAGDDGLYCFRLDPKPGGEADLVWHLDGEKYPDCESSPVFHDGKIYFSLGVGGQALVCVSASDGKELWRVPTPYPAFGSPTVSDGKVFFGMGTGNYVQSAEEVAAAIRKELLQAGRPEAEIEKALEGTAPAGEVWCVDADEPSVLWKFPVGRTVLGAVAAVDGRIYFGSRDKHLYCVSSGGKLIRRWNARSPIVTAPAVGREHVYFVTETGELFGLRTEDLAPAWRVGLNSASLSSPAVARGHVYLGTNDLGFVCAGLPGGPRAEPVWAGALGGPGRGGRADKNLLPQKGSFAWRYPEPDEDAEGQDKFSISVPAAYIPEDEGRALYVGVNYEKRSGLAKLRLDENPSKKPAELWFAESKNPVHLSAAATGKTVLFVDGKPGDEGRHLHLLSAKSGEAYGLKGIEAGASGEMVLTAKGRLFVVDRARGLSCVGLEPMFDEKLGVCGFWSAEVGLVVGMPLAIDDIIVVATSKPAALTALDAPTGRELWRRPLDGAPPAGPVLAAGRIWIGTPRGVRAHDLTSGETLGEIECGAPAAPLVAEGDRIVLLNSSEEIVLVDAVGATELLRIEGADAGMPPVMAGEMILYCKEKAMQIYDTQQKSGKRWLRTSWMGSFAAPLVVVDSHVYFVTDRKGLVCAKPSKR